MEYTICDYIVHMTSKRIKSQKYQVSSSEIDLRTLKRQSRKTYKTSDEQLYTKRYERHPEWHAHSLHSFSLRDPVPVCIDIGFYRAGRLMRFRYFRYQSIPANAICFFD